MHDEREWQTRKQRIDPRLDALGWRRSPSGKPPAYRTEEHETENGPADYALHLADEPVGVVEAKKLTVSPHGVLTQCERYSRGLLGVKRRFGEFGVPFLYSTNGEVIRFHDVRDQRNLSREVADFHTPSALQEMLARDFDADCRALDSLPNDHSRLREYQREANSAIETAIRERKRRMLVAMATGTGKTFMMVNQIYRLMKSGVARRVLFLVDRRALAAQAVRTFAAHDAEPGLKFNQVYEVYSQRFQTGDFDPDEPVRSQGPAEELSDRSAAWTRVRLRLHDPADGHQPLWPAGHV
jgi:type I restriction enzyme R subunit